MKDEEEVKKIRGGIVYIVVAELGTKETGNVLKGRVRNIVTELICGSYTKRNDSERELE